MHTHTILIVAVWQQVTENQSIIIISYFFPHFVENHASDFQNIFLFVWAWW